MRPIQSIICFVPGSSGDFLKAICNEQLTDNQFWIRTNGRLGVANNNFKKSIESIYKNNSTIKSLNDIETEPIENTHYYVEGLDTITENLFYIDYPDCLNQQIIKVYVDKRFHGNADLFFDVFKADLPEPLRHRLTMENLFEFSSINWVKNIKSWRANPILQKINLQDFFDLDAFSNIVKKLTNLSELDEEKFLKTYNHWAQNNNYLKEIFQ